MRAHGTNARARLGPNENDEPGGCHCSPCLTAGAAYAAEYKARTTPAMVDAAPVRAHVNELRAVGIGVKGIAARAGVSHGAMSKLMYGDSGHGRPPSRHLRVATAEKILAVTARDFADSNHSEPVAPILAMIDRLVAAGVRKVRICERLGVRGPGLQIGAHGPSVTRRNGSVIRGMIAELEAGTLTTVNFDRWGNEHTVTHHEAEPPPRTLTGADAAEYDLLLRKVSAILDERTDEADWRPQGNCVDQPVWLFYADDAKTTAKAKKLCQFCPVRAQCLAAHRDEPEGVWGGLTPPERATKPLDWKWPADRPNPWIRKCEACAEVFEQPVRRTKPFRLCLVCRNLDTPIGLWKPKPELSCVDCGQLHASLADAFACDDRLAANEDRLSA